MTETKIRKKDLIGNRVHILAEKWLNNDKPQLIITSVLSFIVVLFIISKAWPIKSFFSLCFTLLCIVISLALIILITKCLAIRILLSLSEHTEEYTKRYRHQVIANENEKAAKEGRKPKERVLGTGPKAEVSLKYFIEMEKTSKIYNARYLGST